MSFDPNRPAGPEPVAPAPPESAAFPSQPVVPTAPTVQVPRRTPSGGWLNAVLVLAVVVAVGGVAFAIGRNTAPVAAAGLGGGDALEGGAGEGGGGAPHASLAPGQSGVPGDGGPFAGEGFGGAGGFTLAGTVQSVTGDTLTITTADGQTLTFSLGSSTTYGTRTPATASDVRTGSKVEIQLASGGEGSRGQAARAPVPSERPAASPSSRDGARERGSPGSGLISDRICCPVWISRPGCSGRRVCPPG
ncbi:MAG: hypothetical protein C0498_12495 [Anaerolinea sp.]|nr:hypothetical protein [Anaerolinea sp.]